MEFFDRQHHVQRIPINRKGIMKPLKVSPCGGNWNIPVSSDTPIDISGALICQDDGRLITWQDIHGRGTDHPVSTSMRATELDVASPRTTLETTPKYQQSKSAEKDNYVSIPPGEKTLEIPFNTLPDLRISSGLAGPLKFVKQNQYKLGQRPDYGVLMAPLFISISPILKAGTSLNIKNYLDDISDSIYGKPFLSESAFMEGAELYNAAQGLLIAIKDSLLYIWKMNMATHNVFLMRSQQVKNLSTTISMSIHHGDVLVIAPSSMAPPKIQRLARSNDKKLNSKDAISSLGADELMIFMEVKQNIDT
jgi:hypothetical protein